MWTHRHPYRSSRLTLQSIQYHGELGLFRALNIGRIVAFVGSGLSVAYGRPNWRELVQSAYDFVEGELAEGSPYHHRLAGTLGQGPAAS